MSSARGTLRTNSTLLNVPQSNAMRLHFAINCGTRQSIFILVSLSLSLSFSLLSSIRWPDERNQSQVWKSDCKKMLAEVRCQPANEKEQGRQKQINICIHLSICFYFFLLTLSPSLFVSSPSRLSRLLDSPSQHKSSIRWPYACTDTTISFECDNALPSTRTHAPHRKGLRLVHVQFMYKC